MEKPIVALIVALMAFVLVASPLPLSVGISICAATDGDPQGECGTEVLQLAPQNPNFVEYRDNPPKEFYGEIPLPMDLSHLDSLHVKPLQDQGPLPSSFDWRDYGKVTPVKQASCGTCWDSVIFTTAQL